MIKDVVAKLDQRMLKTINSFKTDLTRVRTGRATPALLDGVKVDYYGSLMPISQVASVSCPEPRQIVVQPWEANQIAAIEKAILIADLGLNPQNDGKVIRIPLPMLTEERRKDLVKQVKKMGEECKVALRNERRDANEEVKKLEKDKVITQDEAKKGTEQIQKKTDEHVAEVDKVVTAKEKEILSL